MCDVIHRPMLLLAVLVYVALDLSMPAMPGAFTFDAAESVESTQGRARAAGEAVVLPAPARDSFAPSRLLEHQDRLTRPEPIERRRDTAMDWRVRAPHDPSPPSEDPH